MHQQPDLPSSPAARRRARVPSRGGAAAAALAALLLCVPLAEAQTSQQTPPPAGDLVARAQAASDSAVAAFQRGTREALEDGLSSLRVAAALFDSAGRPAEHASSLASMAFLHNRLGRPDSALVNYEFALEVFREHGARSEEGTTLRLMGELHHGGGRVEQALEFYRRSESIASELGEERNRGLALNNIGIAYHYIGALDSALVYLARSLDIRRSVEDRLGEGVTLGNIALVHQTLGRQDAAIAYFRESVEVRRELGDLGGQGTALNNMGFSYERLELPDSALAHYGEALRLLEEAGQRRIVGITLANIGRSHLALGRADSALVYGRRALEVSTEVGDLAGQSWALVELGRAFQAEERPDSAEVYLHSALDAMREVGDRAREGETLFHIARLHHRGMDPPQLERALAYYDSAAAVRARVSERTGGDANRLAFAEQDVSLFEGWTLAALTPGAETGAVRGPAAGLAATERGRAQALLRLLAGTAEPEPGEDLHREGERLAAAATATGSTVISYAAGADTLVIFLADPAGDVHVFLEPFARDSLAVLVADWREALGVDEASVADRTGAEEGLRWIPSLEPGEAEGDRGLGVRRRTCPEDEERGIGVRRRCGPQDASALGARLARALLPGELRARLPDSGELVVVPHGPLALVPFAALPLAEAAGDEEPATALGALFALRYAPSLAILAQVESRPAPAGSDRALDRALVVGDPVMPRVRTPAGDDLPLPPLPGAGREADWVGERIGVDPLRGEFATETAVRARLPGASLIHLATHGFAYSSDAHARDSFIALAPDDQFDGLLTVGQVLDEIPRLTAELVVLSACQTGLGNLKQAEGTVGLQRAFLAKGARSVLVSLWSVSDAATESLMKSFYDSWLGDADRPTKAEALRRAQETLRSDPRFDHPRFWAAFQMVGAG